MSEARLPAQAARSAGEQHRTASQRNKPARRLAPHEESAEQPTRQSAMRPYVLAEHAPGDRVQTDDDWLDYARQAGGTVYHPTSTCRMGQDPLAVVDERLRVRRIEALRVIDASIMPNVVSGNTNAATIMIAEKGADMILADAHPA